MHSKAKYPFPQESILSTSKAKRKKNPTFESRTNRFKIQQ